MSLIFPRFEELPYDPDSSRLMERLKDLPWPVLLDSGNRYNAAYDIVAAAPCRTLVTDGNVTTVTENSSSIESQDDPFDLVREALGNKAGDFSPLPFEGGAIGYFGYDLGRRIEKIPETAKDIDHLPEMMIGIYDWAVVVDHHKHKTWLIGQGRSGETAKIWPDLLKRLKSPSCTAQVPEKPALHALEPFRSSVTEKQYATALEKINDYILAGDCYQVNYTQRFSAPVAGDGWRAYREMRQQNPTPFGAWFEFDDIEVLSFSPERFLQLRQGCVSTEPIKGTRPRARNRVDDLRLKDALYNSAKDRAENLMIVDLLRNDLGRVCVPGTISVPDLFKVESFATVHHLVSRITGELRDDEDALSLLRASFPGGSITGAPKIRAMEIIEELEPYRRGIYCGAIGHIGYNGDMDTNIVIRTLVKRGKSAHYWVGGGIVADSDIASEYQECLDKAAAFRSYFDV